MQISYLIKTTLLIAAYALSMLTFAQNTVKTAPKAFVQTEHVRAELLAYAPEGVEAGKAVMLGLQIAHQPHWHTYWKNSGDSGLPTTLEWELPAGVGVGDTRWPLPKKIPIGNLANYGYEDIVLLPVPLEISQLYKPGLLANDMEIKLKAAWLVCKQECIPEEGEFVIKIPLKGSTALHRAAFESAAKAFPAAVAGAHRVEVAKDGQSIAVAVAGLPAALRGKTLDFFPEIGNMIETAAPFAQAWSGTGDAALWTAKVPLSGQRSESPARFPVVLGYGGRGYRADAGVTALDAGGAQLVGKAAWPALAAAAQVPAALEAALKANMSANMPANAAGLGASGAAGAAGVGAGVGAGGRMAASALSGSVQSLLPALLFALLGGLILNLMPCVFPVLAIKVLGFVQHATPKARVRSGVAYTLGVIASFVALGALMLALRAGGQALGWGFQLQSPAVVAALAALFTLLGLNLAGVFEIGSILPSSVASLQAKNPSVDAFLSGVLAVAVASPCTAPFMGASLGFALGLPAWEALLVFAFIGIGMALPYLAASLVPAVARALPRPGAWMDVFKRAMAFPMFATVVWLVWVLGQQSGIDGAGALLLLLVLMAMILWGMQLGGKLRWVITTISIACFALLTMTLGEKIVKMEELPVAQAASGAGSAAPTWQGNAAPTWQSNGAPTWQSNGAPTWQAWEPGRVEQILAKGQPVFLDFTAAWCVTCQFNKKTTLNSADVLADLKAKNVALLRADWTRRDPAVTAALQQLGRNGVPVYVIYQAGQAPVVLSEILSVGEVRAALAKL
jgi:thiol:disulfide interchange protein/DsbC/DsbD-like thiol-disulfide interchange protein